MWAHGEVYLCELCCEIGMDGWTDGRGYWVESEATGSEDRMGYGLDGKKD